MKNQLYICYTKAPANVEMLLAAIFSAYTKGPVQILHEALIWFWVAGSEETGLECKKS